MTDPTPTPKRRRNYDDELVLACEQYAVKTDRTITAQIMLYPANPSIVIRVDDKLPVGFESARDAAVAVRLWATAP